VTAAVKTGHWLTLMPLVAQETLLVGLFLARRRSTAVSSRPFDWAIAMAGTFLALLLRPSDAPSALAPMGEVLQCVGVAAAALGLASLGRSFGLVAANRGVKTSGAYRLVRHPVYLFEAIGIAGIFLPFEPLWAVPVFALQFLCQLQRMHYEEGVLTRSFPEYAAYAARTPRLIPHLF